MLILLVFAFLSGLVTITAPCIWPLLPIILSSTATGGRRKPFGITLGIMISFAVFTLTISYLVSLFKFDPNILRLFAVVIIAFLGLSLVIPKLSKVFEGLVSRLSGRFAANSSQLNNGFIGGLITGLSLGIVWSPCAGPILATIATLSATKAVNFQLVLVTIVYVIGVGIPLFVFASFGNRLFTKSRFVSKYTGRIQQIFGVIMILTSIAIFTNYDKVLQSKLLDAFPSYTDFIVRLESNELVKKQLDSLKGKDEKEEEMMGKPFSPVSSDSLPNLGKAPEFSGITSWLNSEPLTILNLKGKVVLIDFWTYTCINCIRTLPFVTSWYEKYKDMGFVVVGVHTPEFEFEKKTENVENAIKQYKINYPVAQDNDYKTWDAYNNHYWPAKYLIDKEGNLRKYHFGEGEYEEMEMAIRELLAEGGKTIEEKLTNIEDQTPKERMTPETYLGLSRLDRFASNENPKLGVQNYTVTQNIPDHYFAYQGTWTIENERAISTVGSSIILNFEAKRVFLVMNPSKPNDKIKVFLDNILVEQNISGKDLINGEITLDTDRLYQIINLKEKENHLLRLEFENEGISIYAFTFG